MGIVKGTSIFHKIWGSMAAMLQSDPIVRDAV